MKERQVVVSRGSVELIVLGLLAALVVALAFPMLTRLDKGLKPPASEVEQADTVDPLPID